MHLRLALILLASGIVLTGWGLYIPAKAMVAQLLLERAWSRVLAGDVSAKPWPWADITPMDEIEFPGLGRKMIVLANASGQAMAFGPGHMPNTPAIGDRGTAVVAAHRDTQFRFLGDLVRGDTIVVETRAGERLAYRVSATKIVRADTSGIDPSDSGPNGSRLALVTCYPFDGVLHSPLRFVVIADRVRPETGELKS